MAGNAATTRKRILDAATAEFSRYGIAGARIDRIADEADINKAMIYKYFGSKDGLFEAVFDAVVVQTVSAVPILVEDLPEYVARLWDYHRGHPHPLRIGTWDALERGAAGMQASAVTVATRGKIDAIADGQRRGHIDDVLPPATMLDLLIAISRTGLSVPREGAAPPQHRSAIKATVQRLIQPR